MEYNGNTSQTAAFLKIMLKWWSITNIQSRRIHILKRNDILKPFNSVEDDWLVFLHNLLMWLKRWTPVPKNGSFLTKDTHSAVYGQTEVMIHFIKYALTQLNIPYVLPGKIQTDMLEERFVQYRNRSGYNCNISVVQVRELTGVVFPEEE